MRFLVQLKLFHVTMQVALKEETVIVEEKKAATQTLIESIGQEKAVVDAAVESSRGDEEAAAALQVRVPQA
jgi:dynein heavy chain